MRFGRVMVIEGFTFKKKMGCEGRVRVRPDGLYLKKIGREGDVQGLYFFNFKNLF